MWWHGAGWGWWSVLWIVWMVLFWGGLATVAVVLARRWRPRDPGDPAEEVLAGRYARGEIDEDEFRARLGVLRGAR